MKAKQKLKVVRVEMRELRGGKVRVTAWDDGREAVSVKYDAGNPVMVRALNGVMCEMHRSISVSYDDCDIPF